MGPGKTCGAGLPGINPEVLRRNLFYERHGRPVSGQGPKTPAAMRHQTTQPSSGTSLRASFAAASKTLDALRGRLLRTR